jgi:hypothetical protein
MFNASTDEIGNGLADQDKNDIDGDQFHGSYSPSHSPRQPP